MGIYKVGNNTYPWHIRRRSNLGHIFREKIVSHGPGNTVIFRKEDTQLKTLEITNNQKNNIRKKFGIVDPKSTQKMCHNAG